MKTPDSIQPLILALCLLLPVAFTLRSFGAPGGLDLSFDPGSGIDGAVNTVALQSDGKMIIGGEFTTVRGLARTTVARLHPDGSGDASFQGGIPLDQWGSSQWGMVYSLALQPDDKVLVGHTYGIGRLNADGEFDPTFSADIGAFWEDGTVRAIAVQSDGKVLIAGDFSEVNGTPRGGLARLNTNGSLDRSFFYGAAAGASTLAVQPDGRVLVLSYTTILRLNGDGGLDSTFRADEEISGPSKMALQQDGKILVAGYYQSGGYGISRLNDDGTLDGGFNPSLPPYDGFAYVGSLVALPGGKILFSGSFNSVEGVALYHIARLEADGSLDAGFHPDTGVDGDLRVVALQPDGRLVLGGTFTTLTSTRRQSMARLHADGSLDGSFEPGAGTDGRVSTVVVQRDGKILIGGAFTSVGGAPRSGLARLQADGSLDRTFDPALRFVATASHIRSVAPQPEDGGVIITGIFNTRDENGAHPATIARLQGDGSWDRSFQPELHGFAPTGPCPPFFWSCEYSVAAEMALVQPDGKVIISGVGTAYYTGDGWSEYGYTPFLARFLSDGSLDGGFHLDAAITNPSLTRIMLQPDGKLLLVGSFTLDGQACGMIRVHTDGQLDEGFNAGLGILGSYAYAMALQSDGKVLLGGHSWMLRDTGRYAIVRLNADGSVDDTFDPPTGQNDTVQSLVLQPDGKVLIGGLLSSLADPLAPLVARLAPTGALDAGFQSPVEPGFVGTLALQPDGGVLLGGDFTTVNGAARPHVARLLGDSPMPSLDIARANGSVVLSWPAAAWNVWLDETTDLSLPHGWSRVTQEPEVTGGLLFQKASQNSIFVCCINDLKVKRKQ